MEKIYIKNTNAEETKKILNNFKETRKEEIESIFGTNALEVPLFYSNALSLRFELSQGGSYINMFTTAYDRARKIFEHAFKDSKRIIVVGSYFSNSQKQLSHSVIRSFKNCGVSISRPHECWSMLYDDSIPEEPTFRTLIAFEIKPKKAGCAYRHIRISAEVTVYLYSKIDCSQE